MAPAVLLLLSSTRHDCCAKSTCQVVHAASCICVAFSHEGHVFQREGLLRAILSDFPLVLIIRGYTATAVAECFLHDIFSSRS